MLAPGAKPSLIVADRNGKIAVLGGYVAPSGSAAGGFSSAVEYSAGILYPNAVTTADLNGDGFQDIIIAEGSGNVAVMMNDKSGGFGAATAYAAGVDPAQVAIANLGTGKLDAVVADAVTGAVSILRGNGDGTFGAAQTIGTINAGGAYTVTTALVAGKVDIIVADITGGVDVFSPTTAAGVYTETTYAVGNGPISVSTGDLNGDGNTDLVVAVNHSGTVVMLAGSGNGTFGAASVIATGGSPDAVVVADVNGDGKSDVVYSDSTNLRSGQVSVLLNNTPVATPPTISGTQANVATTDYVAVKPFGATTIGNVATGASIGLLITVKNGNGVATDANGTLSGVGLTKTGVGAYQLANTGTTAATLNSEIQALVFTPVQHAVSAGKTVSTSFALTAVESIGGQVLTATNTTASVVATALNYINGPSLGFGWLTGTQGADVITASGYFNTISAIGGNDFINAGAGSALVNVSSGNVSVALGGSFNTVVGLNGNDMVTGASDGYTSVALGNGNDVVMIGGQHDTIKLGNGNNLVSGTQGMAFITTGSGNDTITLTGGGNTVSAGGGTNAIAGGSGFDTFVIAPAGTGVSSISNFTETNGDVLDLRSALAAMRWNGLSSSLGNYLKVVSSGGNTTLSVAPGSGGGTAVAVLQGVSYGLTDLVSHRSLQTW